MHLDAQVTEVMEWAKRVASTRRTSTLRILIAFDSSYRRFKNIQMAKNYVEQSK